MKVFIYPPNSLILADLVERTGHEPLEYATELRDKVSDPKIDSPPLNITKKEVMEGIEYVPTEAPSGVKGRMGVVGPLIEEADAAIIVKDADFTFGCSGCDRSNSMIKHEIRERDMPTLQCEYPTSEQEAKVMVERIMNFLNDLEEKK